MFTAAPGTYAALYGASAAAPTVAASTAAAGSTTASVSVVGSVAGKTEIEYGSQPDQLSGRVIDGTQAGRRTVPIAGLAPGTTYWYRVRVTAPGGRAAVSPLRKLVTAASDRRAPGASAVSVVPRPDGTAAVGWRTDESAAATLLLGKAPDALAEWLGDRGGRRHTVVATGLTPQATYHYRIRSTDAAGNTTVWPALDRPPATFVSAAVGVADFTGPQLRTGTALRTTVTDDGVRLAGPARTGSKVSRVLDAGQLVTWDRVTYQADVPRGATVRLFVRTGTTSAPGAGWSRWTAAGQGDRVVAGSRYAQYRVELTRAGNGESPVLIGVGITSDGAPRGSITER
jgi:chitodextrinase